MILTELSIGDRLVLAVPLDVYMSNISNARLADILLSNPDIVGIYKGLVEGEFLHIELAGHLFRLTPTYWKPENKWIPVERGLLP